MIKSKAYITNELLISSGTTTRDCKMEVYVNIYSIPACVRKYAMSIVMHDDCKGLLFRWLVTDAPLPRAPFPQKSTHVQD